MAFGSSPILYNAPLTDQAWLIWGAVHQSDHFALANAVTQLTNNLVPVLPIDPVLLPSKFYPPQLFLVWLANHQAIHNALSAALGIGNFDLSTFDPQDPTSVNYFIQYNAYFHQACAAAIGQLKAQQTQTAASNSQGQSVPIQPQPVGVQPEPQASGNTAILPQGSPGIQTVQPQPQPGTAPLPQGASGQPQAAQQPFPTLQPQPGPAPPPGLQPGTPQLPGNPGET